MSTPSLKIAFIGCSHFAAHDVPGQEKNNWTYQFYKKYPQHQYRNYSKGGQGIDHFQWHLLDAKIWGADIVFVNRTYMGRWALQFEANEPAEFDYQVQYSEDNWEEVSPIWDIAWGSVNSGPYMCWGRNTLQSTVETTDIQRYFESNINFWKVQHTNHATQLSYELKWYGNLHKLYNFDHLFLMDWNAHTHSSPNPEFKGEHSDIEPLSSTTWDIAVEQFFMKKHNDAHPGVTLITDPKQIPNWCVSKHDTHFGPNANLLLLNEYILANPKVKKALNI